MVSEHNNRVEFENYHQELTANGNLSIRQPPAYTWLHTILIGLLGCSSWLVVNGLWVELPLFVRSLPEAWNLPTYMNCVIQTANIGPLLYLLMIRFGCCANYKSRSLLWCVQPPERFANYCILTIGLIACLLLIFFWEATLPLANFGINSEKKISFGLLFLTWLAALVDCMSSVTFYAYMSGQPVHFVGALSVGEAISGMVPALVALVQKTNGLIKCVPDASGETLIPIYGEPKFSVSWFIAVLSCLLCISLSAFTILDLLLPNDGIFGHNETLGDAVTSFYQSSSRIQIDSYSPLETSPLLAQDESEIIMGGKHSSFDSHIRRYDNKNKIHTDIDENACNSLISTETASPRNRYSKFNGNLNKQSCSTPEVYSPSEAGNTINIAIIRQKNGRWTLFFSYCIIALISFLMNGFLPSIEGFSAGSYSNKTYQTMLIFSSISSPIAALLTSWWLTKRPEKRNNSTNTTYSSNIMDTSSCPENIRRRRSQQQFERLTTWTCLLMLAIVPTIYVIYVALQSPYPPVLWKNSGPIIITFAWISLAALFSTLRTAISIYIADIGGTKAMRTLGVVTQAGSWCGAFTSFLLIALPKDPIFKPPLICPTR